MRKTHKHVDVELVNLPVEKVFVAQVLLEAGERETR